LCACTTARMHMFSDTLKTCNWKNKPNLSNHEWNEDIIKLISMQMQPLSFKLMLWPLRSVGLWCKWLDLLCSFCSHGPRFKIHSPVNSPRQNENSYLFSSWQKKSTALDSPKLMTNLISTKTHNVTIEGNRITNCCFLLWILSSQS